MTKTINRWSRAAVRAVLLATALGTILPAEASNWGARREFRQGQREIARERREMRREVGRELRHGRWERNRAGAIVAGVALGAVIVGVARGAAPTPPSAELCWYWTDSYQEQGYWDHCGGY